MLLRPLPPSQLLLLLLLLVAPVVRSGTAADSSVPLDTSKLSVKQLNIMLKERGVRCHGCTDKSEFAAKLSETLELPAVYKTDKQMEAAGWGRGADKLAHLTKRTFETFAFTRHSQGEEGGLLLLFHGWGSKAAKPAFAQLTRELPDLVSAAIDAVSGGFLALIGDHEMLYTAYFDEELWRWFDMKGRFAANRGRHQLKVPNGWPSDINAAYGFEAVMVGTKECVRRPAMSASEQHDAASPFSPGHVGRSSIFNEDVVDSDDDNFSDYDEDRSSIFDGDVVDSDDDNFSDSDDY